MHDRRVLGWGWAAGSPVHVSACHWIKVAVRWKYVPKRCRLRSRAVLVVRRCRLRQKYLNVFVEAGSCLTGADFGGRRWIGGAGSSRRHGCHRRGRRHFSISRQSAPVCKSLVRELWGLFLSRPSDESAHFLRT